MCDILRVEWTVIPKSPPRPILSCAGCGSQRPFRSSGRIRLNASGKRLDAWLIYKCTACRQDGDGRVRLFRRSVLGALP
ncbi:DUF1062 domain-containing protein [Neorhizobium sp. DT-125]|uniref:DUF1062 domain-containing protein n=1 Tax=Neorhizobium sp. DT-125 TaxID=3396163 RepID=UPI003F1B4547